MSDTESKYEENAEIVTMSGWQCKTCRHFWGRDEHMARYCCSTSRLCKCGKNRVEKYWTHCTECRDRQEMEKWLAKPAIEWDGAFPIGLWDSDDFFFDKSALMEHLEELGADENKLPNDLRLTTCEPNNGRDFCMTEFLCDELGEDDTLDDDEINHCVNAWIARHAPFSWSPTGKRLCLESVAKHLGLEIEEIK